MNNNNNIDNDIDNKIIIAFSGYKSNGKDTCCNYLVNKYKFVKLSFAEPLKQACKCIFNLTDDELYGDSKENINKIWNITPRKIMQFVGTELFRNQINKLIPDINNDIWVEILKQKIINNENKFIVISDLRFDNEYIMLKKLNAVIIKINRTNYNILDNHESENQLINKVMDYELYNNDSLEILYEQLDIIFNKILIKNN